MYKVLIVEDEDIIRKGLSYTMDWLKHNCILVGKAVDGVDGLQKIKEIEPDIVITDIRMPFMDGLQMLREAQAFNDFEAIVISGYSEFEYAKQAISLGVTEYLLKPLNLTKLDEAIEKLCEKIEKKQIMKEYMNSYDDLSIYEKVLDIKRYSNTNNKTKYVTSMIEYVKDHYSERISIQDLSELFQVSTVYLNTKFKEETSYTFNDFVNRFRIIKAIELLKNENMLIYEVASLVGFQDYKYFSQVFKKYVGYSPTTFLEQMKM